MANSSALLEPKDEVSHLQHLYNSVQILAFRSKLQSTLLSVARQRIERKEVVFFILFFCCCLWFVGMEAWLHELQEAFAQGLQFDDDFEKDFSSRNLLWF